MYLLNSNFPPLISLVALTFLIALVSVVILVPLVRRWAHRMGAVQHGGQHHGQGIRMHKGAMPNIGGVAIFIGFLLAVLVALYVMATFFAPHFLTDGTFAPMLQQVSAILMGATLMCLIGFVDDLWDIPASVRMAAQCVAAGILVLNGIQIGFITDYFGEGQYLYFGKTVSVALTLLWVVGFTNAFNFIDGLDGLSSGIATISSFALLAIALQFDERIGAILLLAALAGAALGFLRHNFNPATIIMGDSGAYFLGYVLAAVSVLGALKISAVVTVATPMLILALPLLNITQVVLRRLRRGVSPAQASNDHLHDLLRVHLSNHERLGRYAKRTAVLILWTITLIFATFGMLLAHTPTMLVLATATLSIIMLSVVSYLRWAEVKRSRPHSLKY